MVLVHNASNQYRPTFSLVPYMASIELVVVVSMMVVLLVVVVDRPTFSYSPIDHPNDHNDS